MINRSINLVTFLILAVMFIITPYYRGLFFDEDFYIWELAIHILFIVYLLARILTKQELNILSFIVFIWPLMYFISFFVAESPFAALQQVFRWMTYAMFFVLIYETAKDKLVRQMLPYVFYITITWIAVFGLIALWGYTDFTDAILGGRVTGVFQYPNTFATIIAMGWLFGLIWMTRKEMPWWQVIIFALPLVMFGVDFLYSYSRGVYILFPAAWLFGLAFLTFKQQVQYILYTILTAGGAFLSYESILENMENTNGGLNQLIIITSVVTAIIVLLHIAFSKEKLTLKWNEKKWVRAILPIGSVSSLTALVLDFANKGMIFQRLPQPLQTRIETINLAQSSVVSRFRFYEQSVVMSKDAPFLGFGGDGWRVLFTKYQEVPYWARETHNFYLELVLNIGWFGTAIFTASLIYFWIKTYQNFRVSTETNRTFILATLTAQIMLLLHAIIDFDFSFGTVCLFFALTIVMALPEKLHHDPLGTQKIKTVLYAISILATAISAYLLFQFHSAHQLVANAEKQLSLSEAEKLFVDAKNKNKWNADYYIELVQVYEKAYEQSQNPSIRERAYNLLDQAYELEPHQPENLYNIGKVYAMFNDSEKAIEFYELAMDYDRFSRKYAFAYIVENVLYGEKLILNNQANDAEQSFQRAIDRYDRQIEYIETFKQQFVPDRRNLRLDPRTKLFVGEAHFLLHQDDQALSILNSVKYNPDNQKQEYLRQQSILYSIYNQQNNNEKITQIQNQINTQNLQEPFEKHIEYFQNIRNRS